MAFEAWKAIDPHWRQLRADAGPEAAETREAWIAERLASGKICRPTLERALRSGLLDDDFEIIGPNGEPLSVGYIRANIAQFIGMGIPDPFEPDYHGGALVAVIYDWGIHSLAHGGQSWKFSASRLADAYAKWMVKHGDV
jgi:hypothetical protein